MRKRTKCEHPDCRRRLSLLDISLPCKCGRVFCRAHRFFESHACDFDYRSQSTTPVRVGKLKSHESQDYSNTSF